MDACCAKLASKANTAFDVWADTAYCSKHNEAWPEKNGFTSRIIAENRQGAMPEAAARAQAAKST
ncbi:MAG: IS5/IS1182 family transposase, partial [Pseudomonadota bacterium]